MGAAYFCVMFLEGDSLNLVWTKFKDFFDLYNQLKNEPRLFYVIGENHHCYIGSVGGRGGMKGLAQRYQKQYVDRSMAIFGSSAPLGQPAFASVVIDPRIQVSDIEPIERQIQDVFIAKHGISNALFSPRGRASSHNIIHSGNAPSFL